VAFRRDRAQIVDDLALIPHVIAGGQNVGAEVEELFGDGRCEPEAAGGILRIHDHEVDLAFLDDMRQVLPHHPSPRTPENVPDKEQFHRDSCLPLVTITVRHRTVREVVMHPV
jgi:hypothetical protein